MDCILISILTNGDLFSSFFSFFAKTIQARSCQHTNQLTSLDSTIGFNAHGGLKFGSCFWSWPQIAWAWQNARTCFAFLPGGPWCKANGFIVMWLIFIPTWCGWYRMHWIGVRTGDVKLNLGASNCLCLTFLAGLLVGHAGMVNARHALVHLSWANGGCVPTSAP